MTPPGSLPDERWLPIVGYEDLYLVSDHGRVYSLPRLIALGHPGSTPARRSGRILKSNKVGERRTHHAVTLQRDKARAHRKVHVLVLEAFVGPRPDGLDGLHWDDNPDNNQLSNLRWGTPRENMIDRIRNGKHHGVNKTHCAHDHEFTPENTYRPPGRKNRMCRRCMSDRKKSRKAA